MEGVEVVDEAVEEAPSKKPLNELHARAEAEAAARVITPPPLTLLTPTLPSTPPEIPLLIGKLLCGGRGGRKCS